MINLYIVATPIGNLEDITLRALKVLREVDLILCEDTRQTKKLLDQYEIKTPTMSYHQHSKLSKVESIIGMLRAGGKIALVSDAGTPCISDPGVQLIAAAVKDFPGINISPVPGASAMVSALSVSGLPTDRFNYLGFIPHKKGRETLFKEISNSEHTVVFYESCHRIIKTLESLQKYLDETRSVVIGRELTKMFETIYRGNITKVLSDIQKDDNAQKGEFVVVIGAK